MKRSLESKHEVRSKRLHREAINSSSKNQKADMLFQQMLHSVAKGNFVFSNDDETFHFLEDPSILRVLLDRKFRFKQQAAENFLDSFDEYIEDEDVFIKLLRRTVPKRQKNVRASSQTTFTGKYSLHHQDSLIRVLLGVEILQEGMVQRLLEKLPEFFGENDQHQKGSDYLPKSILNTLRWLDVVYNSRKLANKLLEILKISPIEMQRSIIVAIPEILDTSVHRIVVEELSSLLNDDSELTVAILDAFSNLNLPTELSDEVITNVIQRLESADIDDLPVVIRFLLQSSNKENVHNVVTEIRKRLNFIGLYRGGKATCDGPLLVIEALQNSIRFQKHVAQAFLRVIADIMDPAEAKMLDIWILFALYSLNPYKKSTALLFRKQIIAGVFGSKLVDGSILKHQNIIDTMFTHVIHLAELFVRCRQSEVRTVGCRMYDTLFMCFTDHYHRQEIIGNMITHIGSGAKEEMNAAIKELHSLVDRIFQQIKPYTPFVKGILDYLDGFDDDQIRKVFSIFSILAVRQGGEKHSSHGGGIANDLNILIRKQLGNGIKAQRIGIIGGVSLINETGRYKSALVSISSGSSSNSVQMTDPMRLRQSLSQCPPAAPITDELASKTIEMLQILCDTCTNIPQLAALLYDELCQSIADNKLHPVIIDWISNSIVIDFEDKYLIDLTEEGMVANVQIPGYHNISMTGWYNLDGAAADIGVNILYMLTIPKIQDQLLCMTPLFRLLQICEAYPNKGSLSGIDALLGCPLVMFDRALLDRFDELERRGKVLLCSSLLHAINWIREIISAYCCQDDLEMQGKICIRLYHLIDLHELLQKCLTLTPNFVPLGLGMDISGAEVVDEALVNNKSSEKKKKEQNVSIYYRHLHVSIFRVLVFPLVLGKDGKKHEKFKRVEEDEVLVQLNARTMLFLLSDFKRKLKKVLSSPKFVIPRTQPGKNHNFTTNNTNILGIQCNPSLLLSELVHTRIFCKLNKHADVIRRSLESSLHNDEDINDEIEQEKSQLLQSLVLMIDIMMLILRSDKLDNVQGSVMSLISQFCKGVDCDENNVAVEDRCNLLFNFLGKFLPAACIMGLIAVVSIIKLMDMAAGYPSTPMLELKKKLSSICAEKLMKEWGDKVPLRTNTIGIMVRIHIRNSFKPLETISKLACTILPTMYEEEENQLAEESENIFHATLNKKTLVYYYVPILEILVKEFTKKINKRSRLTTEEILTLYQKISLSFMNLSKLCKQFPKKSVMLTALIKQGTVFLDHAAKNFSILEQHFSTQKNTILKTIKNIQQGTRVMQIICAHGKKAKITNITTRVPRVKRAMERFIYICKSLFQKHKVLGAFWQGNLKHRKMDGTEIDQNEESDDEGDDEGDLLYDNRSDSGEVTHEYETDPSKQ